MAKIPCGVCGGLMRNSYPKLYFRDGAICINCLKNAGVFSVDNPLTNNVQTIREVVLERQKRVACFSPTKNVGNHLYVDENNRLFKIQNDVFDFENIVNFELLENESVTVTKGGTGRAIAGGLLFGGVGAIVGGATAKKHSNAFCNSMKIRISLRNTFASMVYIHIILNSAVKTNSPYYTSFKNTAVQCISLLEIICDTNENKAAKLVQQSQNQLSPKTLSIADEILKLKQLMDQEIITQEEFENAKKKLLNC